MRHLMQDKIKVSPGRLAHTQPPAEKGGFNDEKKNRIRFRSERVH